MTFGWPAMDNSRVILIGIANSLDLTERLLPRLKMHTQSCPPQLMQFNAYTQNEIAAILTHRHTEIDAMLDPKAIELCARKVAAMTGDIRKAFNVYKLTVEQAQRETTKNIENEQIRPPSPSTSSSCSVRSATSEVSLPSLPQTPRVGCREVLRTVNEVYGCKAKQVGTHLPMQSKLIVVAAIKLTEQNDNKGGFTIDELMKMYTRVCSGVRGVEPMGRSDFLASCELLNDHGLMAIITITRHTPNKRVNMASPSRKNNVQINIKQQPTIRLLMDTKTVRAALNDETLVTSAMSAL